jgi:hypothetical protein
VIPVIARITALEAAMMGRRSEQWSLFYQFRLDERVPKDHLLRRIDRFVTASLADIHERLEPHYSEIGRPSVDPELMIRMLIVGYCYGLRSERRLTQEVPRPDQSGVMHAATTRSKMADASRYHGKAPDEILWSELERQTRAVKEYLAALEAEVEPNPDRKPPKVISHSDPCAAWTAKANKRVVWLRPQLSHRDGECSHRRCRANASADLR